jgi:2'-5' RNA ligase
MTQAPANNMYYLAIICPDETDKQVMQFKLWMKEHFGSVTAMKSPAHITIIPPFWLSNEKEQLLLDLFHAFTSDISGIPVLLENFGHFGKKVLFINVHQNELLQKLKHQSDEYFTQHFNNAIKIEDHPFYPHITIATRDMKPGDFFTAWERFSREKFSANFMATTLSLLKLSPEKWNVIAAVNWNKKEGT